MKRIKDRVAQFIRSTVREAMEEYTERADRKIGEETRQWRKYADTAGEENRRALEQRVEECAARQEERAAEQENSIKQYTEECVRQAADELFQKLVPQLEQSVQGQLMDGLFPKIDKQIERWTWERYLRIQNKLVPQIEQDVEQSIKQDVQGQLMDELLPKIDKQIERWTWERYRRTKRDGMGNLWNVLFELNPEKMRQLVGGVSSSYDIDFYLDNRHGSIKSAARVLRTVFSWVPHASVVDFGCGSGTWLWTARELGAQRIFGIDGAYVPKPMRLIPDDSFLGADLEHPVKLSERFDMAMSLEVAEHLSPEAADGFVESLCAASDVVLFSAAHPGQSGDHHINEQPLEYWQARFAAGHYQMVDIRPVFRDDQSIEWWYRSNMVLFVHDEKYAGIAAEIEKSGPKKD